jgi:hypothetical protein
VERLYGLREGDLEVAARRLSEHIGLGEPHESLYLGGDYYLWHLGDAEVRLQHNRELDDELADPDYPDYPLLVRVSGTEAPPSWDATALKVGLTSLGVDSGK